MSRRNIGQLEAHDPAANIRQTGHPTFKPERAAVELRRQAIAQCPMSAQTGPAKPAQETTDHAPAGRQQQQAGQDD